MGKPTLTLIVQQRFWESIACDFVSYGSLLAMIGLGWWIDSAALQWVGAIMWMICIMGRVFINDQKNRCTPQQAADRLKAEFGVVAQPAHPHDDAGLMVKKPTF